ncbi:prepilin peptidase, partial [Myxococcus sp. CA039A]|nr:prepilin peptidase [Myxococcus sp. CA039A]
VGAVLGFPASMAAAAFISLVGAAQAVVSLLWQGAVWDTVAAALRRWAVRLHLARSDAQPTERRHIPYGVAIALGTLWALWWQHESLG